MFTPVVSSVHDQKALEPMEPPVSGRSACRIVSSLLRLPDGEILQVRDRKAVILPKLKQLPLLASLRFGNSKTR